MFRSAQRVAQISSHLRAKTPIDKVSNKNLSILSSTKKMSHLFEDATPAEVKNANVCLQERPNLDQGNRC